MTDKFEMTQTFAWQLDIGKLRDKNQDSVGAAKFSQGSAEKDISGGIYVVADGVGGEDDGEKASRIAVETFMTAMMGQLSKNFSHEEYRARLKTATHLAHRQIRLNTPKDKKSMTTLVAALVINETVHIANVGDSRAYLLRDGTLRQITRDHTVAQELVDTGALTESQADKHRYSHVLSRAVGSSEPVETDVFTEHLQIDDYLLLCSDGLYGVVSNELIVQIIKSASTTTHATERLIKAANSAGGPDNISVVLVKIRAKAHA